jgi:CubicO group peptidase (beta-lactamase class C family)
MSEHRLGHGPPKPQTPPPPDEWIRRLGTLPLMHQPGEKWMERIFAPLGMKDTGFSVPATTVDRLATSYEVDPRTGALALYDEAKGGEWSRPPVFPSAGGGLVSTIDDYLAFGQMLLSRGKHGSERILSRPSVETMTRRDDVAGPVGSFGWDGGLGTSWRSDPSEGLVGILMTQRAWTSPTPPDVCLDFWMIRVGAPKWPPHPRRSEAPRRSRGAPRPRASVLSIWAPADRRIGEGGARRGTAGATEPDATTQTRQLDFERDA